VQFAKGAGSAVIEATLEGDATVDYRVRAGAGQVLTVGLRRSNPQNYVNINPPGSDASLFVARRGHDGTATVEARSAGGLKRSILFIAGRPVASDAQDPPKSSRKGDLSIVEVGAGESYEIPDALLGGG
jgi:hypothetical protein